MVCPNCKSNDIVAIQGQNYCINCGQRVDVPAAVPINAAKAVAVDISGAGKAASKPKPSKAAAVTQKAPQIKIRTKPKAPAPAPKSNLIINHPTVSAPKITVISAAGSDPVAKIPARSSSKAAPLDLRSNERKQVLEARQSMLAKPGKAPTRLSDVKPARPIPAPAKPDSNPLDPASTPKAAERKTEPPRKPTEDVRAAETTKTAAAAPKFAGEGSALVFAWKQLGNWRYLAAALFAGLAAAVPSLLWRLNVDTVSFYRLMQDGPNQLLGTGLLTDVARYGSVWLAGMALAYLVHVGAANAVTYAMAKLSDGHSSKPKSWLKTALNSLWGVVRIDLALLPLWGLLIGLEAYVLSTVAYGTMPQVQQLALLIVAHSVLVYAAFALIFTRILGGYAVVITGLPVSAAIALGWKLYRKRSFALAVSGIIGAAVSTLIYLPAMALNYANRDLPAEVSGLGQLFGAAAFAVVLSSFTLVFVTAYFFKHYRRSVLAVFGPGKAEYLAAKQTRPVRRTTKITLGTVVAILAGAGLTGYLGPQAITTWLEQAIRLVNP